MQCYWVGFDVGKAFHWVCVLDEEGEVVFSRKVETTEQALEECREQIAPLGGERKIGTDLLGGPATRLEAMLLERGERVFHLPGIAVNRAREGYRGEHKSDAKDAWVIADQLRMRWKSFQEIGCRDEATAQLRALVSTFLGTRTSSFYPGVWRFLWRGSPSPRLARAQRRARCASAG